MTNLITRIPETLKRSPVESVLVVFMVAVLSYFLVPLSANALQSDAEPDRLTALTVAAMQNETAEYGQLPESDLRGTFYVKTVQASAYNSVPWQTDDTPFITASGTHVRHGVLAANFLPIGTRVTIPDYYGDQVFIVEDRMNPRYTNNVDIWMESIDEARQFGRRTVTIHVYPGK